MKKNKDIKSLITAQKRVWKISERTNRALGLSYKVVRNGKLIEVHPDGASVVLRKSVFDTVRLDKKHFVLADG
ncbi:hypothetical protein [Sinomicrobium soli]|uniref:hypothetical protein n=1 Tax=Sinomicrobium sp. N-1-3-6 TaxID=2219864 RepID=UPI0011BF8602|nr:hypothetical protein [Sinomicrobium sp. N-1-3-6]